MSADKQVSQSIGHQLQRLKAEYNVQQQDDKFSQLGSTRQLNERMVEHIINEIKKGNLRDGSHVSFNMHMDHKRQGHHHLDDINLLLKEYDITATCIHIKNTEMYNAIVNPLCCLCCPCIFCSYAICSGCYTPSYNVVVCIENMKTIETQAACVQEMVM